MSLPSVFKRLQCLLSHQMWQIAEDVSSESYVSPLHLTFCKDLFGWQNEKKIFSRPFITQQTSNWLQRYFQRRRPAKMAAAMVEISACHFQVFLFIYWKQRWELVQSISKFIVQIFFFSTVRALVMKTKEVDSEFSMAKFNASQWLLSRPEENTPHLTQDK